MFADRSGTLFHTVITLNLLLEFGTAILRIACYCLKTCRIDFYDKVCIACCRFWCSKKSYLWSLKVLEFFLFQLLYVTHIYSLDEPGYSVCHKPPKVLAQKGQRSVGAITSAKKGKLS